MSGGIGVAGRNERAAGPTSAECQVRSSVSAGAPPGRIDQRSNALLLGVAEAVYRASIGLLGPLTLVPLFVSTLTDDPLAIGGLAAAFHLGSLTQLVAAGYVERSARKLPWVLGFTGLERLPALGLAGCALAATSIRRP